MDERQRFLQKVLFGPSSGKQPLSHIMGHFRYDSQRSNRFCNDFLLSFQDSIYQFHKRIIRDVL